MFFLFLFFCFLFFVFFLSTAVWTKQCYACTESNAATCRANQESQSCATDPDSLGITECASAATKYQDMAGNVQEGFIRGCLDCSGSGEAHGARNKITVTETNQAAGDFSEIIFPVYQYSVSVENHTFFREFGVHSRYI